MPLLLSSGLSPFLHLLSTHCPASHPNSALSWSPGSAGDERWASKTSIHACCWHSASFSSRRTGTSDKAPQRQCCMWPWFSRTQMWRWKGSKPEYLTWGGWGVGEVEACRLKERSLWSTFSPYHTSVGNLWCWQWDLIFTDTNSVAGTELGFLSIVPHLTNKLL